jgi:hypothetical protein
VLLKGSLCCKNVGSWLLQQHLAVLAAPSCCSSGLACLMHVSKLQQSHADEHTRLRRPAQLALTTLLQMTHGWRKLTSA